MMIPGPVRAHHSHAGIPDQFREFLFAGDTIAAHFLEPGGDDHKPADTSRDGLFDDGLHELLGDDDDGEVDWTGHITDRGVGWNGMNRRGLGVYRIDRPLESFH